MSFQEYIENVLGLKPIIQKQNKVENLPFFIYDRYKIYKVSLYDNLFVVMVDNRNFENTPENIKKQINIVTNKTDMQVIYVHPGLSSFQRKRLIDYQVNFVVPNNQMYLPYLKIDLREHFKQIILPKEKLTPSTQAIIIFSQLNNIYHLDSQIIKENLKYSAMSISRSFREIKRLKLGKIERVGKKNILKIDEDRKKVWQRTLPYMDSPVKRGLWISEELPNCNLPLAGLSALAKFTMIATPKNTIYAIFKKDWCKISKNESIKKMVEPFQTKSNIRLQVWSYSPNLKSKGNIVDKYSLFLSLKDEKDERIEHALENMMDVVLNG